MKGDATRSANGRCNSDPVNGLLCESLDMP